MHFLLTILSSLFVFSIFLVPIPTLAQPGIKRNARKCGDFCSFRLCGVNASISQLVSLPTAFFVIFGLPREAILPFICRPGMEDTVELVTQFGEARVYDPAIKHYIPISLWRPQGLSHPFSKDFIGAFKLSDRYKSGVSVSKESRGNQWSYLNDQCMILPIEGYNSRTPSGLVPMTTEGEQNACVAFRVTAPELRFHLNWDTGDDLDLLVEEPDGDVIYYNTPFSESGRLNNDNNRGLCLSNLIGGKENVVYLPGNGRQPGRYVAEVTMHAKCTSQPTWWTLQVILNGALQGTLSGFETEGPAVGEFRFLGSRSFTIPRI